MIKLGDFSRTEFYYDEADRALKACTLDTHETLIDLGAVEEWAPEIKVMVARVKARQPHNYVRKVKSQPNFRCTGPTGCRHCLEELLCLILGKLD